MSFALAWFSAPDRALLRRGLLVAITCALASCARATLEWEDGGAAMPGLSTQDAGNQEDTGAANEQDSGTPVQPPDDAGSNDPDPVTDASQNQDPPLDASDPVDPDDRTPSPDNAAACPSVAPEPPFGVELCAQITLRCHYGQTYECTCYAAGWLCLND